MNLHIILHLVCTLQGVSRQSVTVVNDYAADAEALSQGLRICVLQRCHKAVASFLASDAESV